jgi:small-conductance mechanosensitive channel
MTEEADPIAAAAGRLERLAAPLREAAEGLPTLALGAGALALGAALALLLRAGLRWLLLRTFRRPDGFVRAALERSRRMSRIAFALLGAAAAMPAVDWPEGWAPALSHLFAVGFVAIAGWAVVLLLRLTTDRHLRRFSLDEEDNLQARKYVTQVRVLRRAAEVVIALLTLGAALLTFESVQEYGAGLFASAGVAGIVAAVAARPVLANLFAGVQIALSQPIRIDDAVFVEGEWGWIEEIRATYVVVKIWDWRRLVLPISYFIEKPFQNWTKESASIIGQVSLWVDYAAPFDAMRAEFERLIRASPDWDGQVAVMQVIEATKRTVQVRALMSARSSPRAWDLRCEVREKIVSWLQRAHPEALPTARAELRGAAAGTGGG